MGIKGIFGSFTILTSFERQCVNTKYFYIHIMIKTTINTQVERYFHNDYMTALQLTKKGTRGASFIKQQR